MKEIIGNKYGRLTVVAKHKDYILPCKKRVKQYLCKCDCGKEVIVYQHSLTSGHTRSCGCIRFKTNEYDLSGEFGIGYTKKGEVFYFDKEDYDKIKDYCWGITKYGYLMNTYKDKLLHRVIMGEPKGKVIDHINHNKLDNRKLNLRICTHQQNTMNLLKPKNNTSGCMGVCFNKETNKWRVRIMVDGKSKHLGYYNNYEQAVQVRIKAEKEYFKEYACDQNF